MTRSSKLLCLLACAAGLPVSAASVIIKADDVRNSDITFRPMLPIQGKSAKIAVKVHSSATTEQTVKVSISQKEAPIGEQTVNIKQQGTAMVEFDWTPADNGTHQFEVNATGSDGTVTAKTSVPVISRPLYFPWFGGHTSESLELKYANVVLSGKPEQFDYWRNRGAIPCLWKGALKDKTPEQYTAYLSEGLGNPEKGPAGIMIDEMGGYDPAEIVTYPFFKGLVDFNKINPQYFTALWICGSLQIPYCNITKNVYRKTGVDLLMLECYSNFQVVEFSSFSRFSYYDQRIQTARQQDVLSNTVMTIAIEGHADKFNLKPYEIEDEVRYIRRQAPEMPGIGYFLSETKTPELRPWADDLCYRYFIAPVLQVWAHDIQFTSRNVKVGDKLEVLAGVNNIGATDARGVKVKVYADSRQIAEETIDIPALRSLGVPRAIQVKTQYTAEKSGYVKFRVEIIPAPGQTLLDGSAENTIFIR